MSRVDSMARRSSRQIDRRRMLMASALAGLQVITIETASAEGLLTQTKNFLKKGAMQDFTKVTMNWDVTFCSYGLDIDVTGQSSVKTLWNDNWFKDADGNEVSSFYSGFGAAWGVGSAGMGGSDPRGSRLPKTFRLTYYDFLEDRFYQVDGELPQQRIFELFKQRSVDKEVNYGTVRPRFDDLRIGVAPRGNIMVWAAGLDQVELQTYKAQQVMKGVTRQSYNASLPGGTFTLMEDRDRVLLKGGRIKPETLARIHAGWVPDPAWYMRTIRVKYPWRHRLTGNVSRITELESYQINGESQSVGAWEIGLYPHATTMCTVPVAAKFWFHDKAGNRHHLWLSFSLRDRAVSEEDVTEVRAAFEQMFPGRTLEDNVYAPLEQDMATVEVNISDDFKTISANLVKGDVRLPLPVGKTQHFALEPFTHWPGMKSEEVTSKQRRLFAEGPGA